MAARQVRAAAAGGRNHRLNRAAFNLGQIAANGLLDSDTITEQLHTAALGAGLGAREATATIRSGLRAGMRHPRTPAHTRPLPRPTSNQARTSTSGQVKFERSCV